MAVNYAPSKLELGEVEYPASDGELMDETGFHVTLIAYILSMCAPTFRIAKMCMSVVICSSITKKAIPNAGLHLTRL